ncbi:autotransporter assembly complex protein TamA [Pleionea litopenaei]|uniref:Translocation and assembly module subunit TamA n=1 Tax=Pleionea litopenaei TaxID=3070815 RepID=A0AA51X7Z0_9GAMM|nr:BamA/TamA family outer membrane protein [Pleionea sp. HL-JVS1]WMS88733.1 BamA/TamA family outer membrane protein [Pleionea sp. HL-JVS1]
MLNLSVKSPNHRICGRVISRLLLLSFGIFSILSVHSEEQPLQGTPIDITGIEDQLLENVKAHLDVQDETLTFSTLGLPRSNEYILRKSNAALQAFGYYRPTLDLTGDHRHWYLTIQPGPETKWQSIDLKIKDNIVLPEALSNLVNNLGLVTGQTVNHERYQTTKNKLLSTARHKGFLSAHFSTSQLIVAKDFTTADIHWVLELGPRYTIKSVQFSENKFSGDLLQSYVDIQQGDFYDADLLVKIQQQLNRSGFFESVGIDQDIDDQHHTVAVTFDVLSRAKYELKTSLGYGTDSRGRIGVEWKDQQVNLEGHRYSIAAEANSLSQSVAFIYRIPLQTPGSEWLGRASYQIKDDSIASSKISSFESRWIIKQSDFWTQQFAATIATEENSQNATIESYLEYLVPSWQVDYYSTRDPFRAEKGFHWRSIVRMSDDVISDPTLDFWQWEQNLKWIQPISEHWRFLSRTSVGLTIMKDQDFINNMPTSYRFFAGGDTSVRGYAYQTLGPTNNLDEVIGGKYLFTQSLEVDWQFKDNWRWAWFVDAGNAFSSDTNQSLYKSVGTGIRWVTPVGSVRLDVAKALDLTEEWRWHITIGPDL